MAVFHGAGLRPHSSAVCTEPVQSLVRLPGQEDLRASVCAQPEQLSWTGP